MTTGLCTLLQAQITNGTDFRSVGGISKISKRVSPEACGIFVILPCERRAGTTVFYFQNVWILILVPSFIYTKKTIVLCVLLSPQIRAAKM